jgi:uracil-DNA glycosylase
MTHLLTNLETDWKSILEDIFNNNLENTENLTKHINLDKETNNIYPPENMIFNSFSHFNFSDLKVIIMGQDPYHQPGQAMGLSFSVPKNIKIPPSLRNIFKELKSNFSNNNELELEHGDLTYIANQGVLLLNRTLTVIESKPNSHKKYWKFFTDALLKYIIEKSKNKIFLLWGNDSKSIKTGFIKQNIDYSSHHFLESAHPSPLSANKGGWYGCKHFKKTNELLLNMNIDEINWFL